MEIKEITHNGMVLARYIPNAAWKKGLSFFSKDEEFIQVGAWDYDQGKVLAAHIHNQATRSISHTQEVLYVRQGSLKASIYSPQAELITELIIKSGDTLVLLNGGHGYTILEEDTQVLEIKNGPYLGADIDRTRIV